jgi:ABC-type antimicrobial peptide transport system permease subunit
MLRLETLRRDVTVGVRVLIKEKSFCALAVIVLALGIAGVTTMFSVVNGVMLRGFSFPTALIGAAVGVGLAYASTDWLHATVRNLENPPPSWITLVSLVATLVPARRATRVDPMIALRAE